MFWVKNLRLFADTWQISRNRWPGLGENLLLTRWITDDEIHTMQWLKLVAPEQMTWVLTGVFPDHVWEGDVGPHASGSPPAFTDCRCSCRGCCGDERKKIHVECIAMPKNKGSILRITWCSFQLEKENLRENSVALRMKFGIVSKFSEDSVCSPLIIMGWVIYDFYSCSLIRQYFPLFSSFKYFNNLKISAQEKQYRG